LTLSKRELGPLNSFKLKFNTAAKRSTSSYENKKTQEYTLKSNDFNLQLSRMGQVRLHLDIQAYAMFPCRVVNMYNIVIHIDLIVEFYSYVFPIEFEKQKKKFLLYECYTFVFIITMGVASHSSLLSISVSISWIFFNICKLSSSK